ncbi:MAG TPA: CBS domain-containing protein [Burkholderiaceae bacterium]
MRIGEICSRSVVTCRRETRIADLARMMRDQHVGSVVVVEAQDGPRPRPVGVVTDRHIVVQVVAAGADAASLVAGDLIVGGLVRANESETLHDALWHMRGRGIRRLPVVDDHDGLVGVITADDLTRALAEALLDLAGTSSHQIASERARRS